MGRLLQSARIIIGAIIFAMSVVSVANANSLRDGTQVALVAGRLCHGSPHLGSFGRARQRRGAVFAFRLHVSANGRGVQNYDEAGRRGLRPRGPRSSTAIVCGLRCRKGQGVPDELGRSPQMAEPGSGPRTTQGPRVLGQGSRCPRHRDPRPTRSRPPVRPGLAAAAGAIAGRRASAPPRRNRAGWHRRPEAEPTRSRD